MGIYMHVLCLLTHVYYYTCAWENDNTSLNLDDLVLGSVTKDQHSSKWEVWTYKRPLDYKLWSSWLTNISDHHQHYQLMSTTMIVVDHVNKNTHGWWRWALNPFFLNGWKEQCNAVVTLFGGEMQIMIMFQGDNDNAYQQLFMIMPTNFHNNLMKWRMGTIMKSIPIGCPCPRSSRREAR